MNHNLKIESKYAERIVSGEKNFEIRLNDRDYQRGDTLTLSAIYEPGRTPWIEFVTAQIDYIHSGYGMQDDFVVLGLKNVGFQEEIR